MALTPSAIPFAAPGSPVVANPDATTTAEAGAVPGGFLGMLGTLVAAPPAGATATATASPPGPGPQASTLIGTLLGVASEGSTPDAAPDAASDAPAEEGAVPPEAAAAAMAVMAQMLAGTRAVVQVAASVLPSQAAPSVATPSLESTQAAEAPEVPVGASQADAAEPALAVLSAAPAPRVTPASTLGSVTLAPKPVAAERVDAPSLSRNGAPSVDAPKASAFQSLTALLVVTARGNGTDDARAAEAPPQTGEAPRNGAAFTTLLATSPVSGDAATADAQQPVLIREPVGTAQWADSIGARLTMMATRGEQQGSLRLSPEHLGPVEVQIRTQDDGKASVWFGAQHADTRAALQDALPRLRELFAAQGLQLGDAGVSRDPPRQQAAQAGGSSPGLAGGNAAAVPLEELSVALPAASVNRHVGLLDTYA